MSDKISASIVTISFLLSKVNSYRSIEPDDIEVADTVTVVWEIA